MPPLVHLDLSQNPFNSLPDDFFVRHTSLKALDLSHTRLEALPAGLSRCQGLVWLAIQGLNLRQFPEEIGACRRLRVLYLGQHPQLLAENILSVLGEMGQLHTLKILQLNNQPLILSPTLARLEGLVELDLKGNRLADTEALLGQLAQLPNLQALNLANCGVRQAYSSFQSLKSLRLLGLDLKSMPLGEVQKIPILLAPGAEVVDGTEFFSYRMMQEGGGSQLE
ncbi:MAG: leucine-rich repeat domain-containing protein [Microscillaceae bacterium]|nr:leucine-rich repeat domain-containing protein [Microscillaceae bacterium]